ncbi:MAG: metalloregulator ArsR/SmtB family transcription factor [Anaerolineaceae bacterium]|jgi:rhodanese-related sulfurtransferase/DNA-binding transcriptional ArsR family regulator|nr:metalloregulator ArsR/SmtB family transcription factor [Anaerolineaceae bacterium]
MQPLDPDFRTQLFEQFSRICKALGNPHRLELLFLLVNGEHSVDRLSHETGMAFANTSQHLQNLKRSGLILSRRAGSTIFYRLADPSILPLLQAARSTAESRLAEVDRLLDQLYASREALPHVDFKTLQTELDKEETLLVDVRPKNEFQDGHLPHAVSIPLNELENRLSELSPQQNLIIICRDMYSTLSDQAVQILIQHGFQAARLSLGFMEWKAQGGEIVYTAY